MRESTVFTQRTGFLANRMNFLLIPVNSTVPESVTVNKVSAIYRGSNFTDPLISTTSFSTRANSTVTSGW